MAQLGNGNFASGLAGAALNEALINEIAKIKDPAIQQWVSYIIGNAAAEAIGGTGTTGGSTAASGTKNNWQGEERDKSMLGSLGLNEQALEEAKNQISQNDVQYDPNKPFEVNVHDILDAGGLIPIIGIAADGANALLYCYDGDYINALIASGAAVPILEYGVAGIKLTQKVDKAEDFVQKFDFDLQLFAKDGSKIPNTTGGNLVDRVKSETLSVSNIRHISKHIPSEFGKQATYLSDELLVNKLSKTTFFNPEWTEKQIILATEEAYSVLRSQGKTGLQSYKINGDEIMIFIKLDGTFDTAYGLHKLTIDFFRK